MGYAKKKFDGIYLTYYNKIKSSNRTGIKDVKSFKPVTISNSVIWEGNAKESANNSFKSINQGCNKIYANVNVIVKKAKIICNVLWPELESLKSSIEAYNDLCDLWESTNSDLSSAIAAEKAGGINS